MVTKKERKNVRKMWPCPNVVQYKGMIIFDGFFEK